MRNVSEDRSETGQFQKGKSGNPAGRPKRPRDLVERCRDMTLTALAQVVEVLECDKSADRLRAAELILAYGWGRPPQKMELTGAKGKAVKAELLFDSKTREAIVRAAIDRLRTGGHPAG